MPKAQDEKIIFDGTYQPKNKLRPWHTRDARSRFGEVVRCHHFKFESGGSAKSWTLSRRFHVSARQERYGILDITVCDIKTGRARRMMFCSLCVHRARDCNVVQRAPKPARGAGQC